MTKDSAFILKLAAEQDALRVRLNWLIGTVSGVQSEIKSLRQEMRLTRAIEPRQTPETAQIQAKHPLSALFNLFKQNTQNKQKLHITIST